MNTKFATAQRVDNQEIKSLFDQVKRDKAIVDIVNCFPNIVLVLNEYRQIVYYNKALAPDFNAEDANYEILGKRPGELFCCIHACQEPGGCGTSEDCQYCGAVISILAAMQEGSSTQECRLTRIVDGEELAQDFRITSVVTKVHGHDYVLFMIADISSEKRKELLERVFFHDVLNTIGALHSTIDLLAHSKDESLWDELSPLLPKLSSLLLEEVRSQQDLLLAERGSLKPNFQPLIPCQIIEDVVANYEFTKYRQDRTIRMENQADLALLSSDPVLIKRIVGNMLKNALEAAENSDLIKLGTYATEAEIVFFVQNPQVLPDAARSQIFKRSYSTKGSGRGVGTYSMRLLAEKYLDGSVVFKTSEATGTVFELHLPLTKED